MTVPPERFNDSDGDLLGSIRKMYSTIDPVPPDLVTRVQFALALEDVDVEVLRLIREPEPAVRAEPDGDESRTVTFESHNVTIMIVLSAGPDDTTVRMDGWVAPPAPFTIEVRTLAGTVHTNTDDDGKFVCEQVVHGMVQIIVRPPAGGHEGLPRMVVTPAIMV